MRPDNASIVVTAAVIAMVISWSLWRTLKAKNKAQNDQGNDTMIQRKGRTKDQDDAGEASVTSTSESFRGKENQKVEQVTEAAVAEGTSNVKLVSLVATDKDIIESSNNDSNCSSTLKDKTDPKFLEKEDKEIVTKSISIHDVPDFTIELDDEDADMF